MFKRIQLDAPGIIEAEYIKGFELLVTFDNGEQRIWDGSKSMLAPRGLPYRSPEKFKDFSVTRGHISWGDYDDDNDFQVFYDSIYDHSFPISAIVSSSGFTFLSMAQVKDTTPFPISRLSDTIKMYTHHRGEDRHHEIHVHVFINPQYKNEPFKLDGTPIVGAPNPPFTGKIRKALTKWLSDNRAKIAESWNKENPENPIDPNTGNFY